ncbi:MAG: signal peptidase I [bacterium]|nr:signal peptidase I [bacterium]
MCIKKKRLKIEMIKDLIKKEGCSKWWWKIQGYSMWPFFHPKDQVLLKMGISYEEIKIGDIVLYENGEYFILHRVINIQNKVTLKNFLLKGDFLLINDGMIPSDEIIAKVVLLKKCQMIINIENSTMEKVNFIIAKLSLIFSLFFSPFFLFKSYIPLIMYGYYLIWCLIGWAVLIYIYISYFYCLILDGGRKDII